MLRHHCALGGLLGAVWEGPGQATVASRQELFYSFSPLLQRGAHEAVSEGGKAAGRAPFGGSPARPLPPRSGLSASTSGRSAAPCSALCVPAAEARAWRAVWRRRALGPGDAAGRRARASAARVRTAGVGSWDCAGRGDAARARRALGRDACPPASVWPNKAQPEPGLGIRADPLSLGAKCGGFVLFIVFTASYPPLFFFFVPSLQLVH